MWEYGFSLTRILPYNGKIVDSVLTRENTGQRKPVFSHILCSNLETQHILLRLHEQGSQTSSTAESWYQCNACNTPNNELNEKDETLTQSDSFFLIGFFNLMFLLFPWWQFNAFVPYIVNGTPIYAIWSSDQ